jgi:hypothetical protein
MIPCIAQRTVSRIRFSTCFARSGEMRGQQSSNICGGSCGARSRTCQAAHSNLPTPHTRRHRARPQPPPGWALSKRWRPEPSWRKHRALSARLKAVRGGASSARLCHENGATLPGAAHAPRILADRVQYNPLAHVTRTLMSSLKVAGKCTIDEFMIDFCIAEGCDIFYVLREDVKFGCE